MDNIVCPFQEADGKLKEQILDQVPTSVIAVNKDFDIIYVNDSVSRVTGKKREDLIGHKCYDLFHSKHCSTNDCCVKKAIISGETFKARNEVTIGNNVIQIVYYAVPLKDENGQIIGGLEFALDISEQIQYENKLREQSNTIRQMSTPTIKLWDGVLVLPIVGVIDSMRAQYMMESMLNKIVESYSKVIILDIQGVAAVDTAVANHLIKITKATKLMGCECILSGISPAVAQTIIQLGIDMKAVNTRSTLKDALAEAFSILNLEVKEKK